MTEESHSDAPVQAGDVLAGKYRVEQVLGVGGMGVVVAATHLQLQDRVALKFLLPQVAESAAHVQRFLREAQAAVKIKSAHVARVVDVGVLETGSPYMVMEYLTGADLSKLLEQRGRLPVNESVTYMLQACEALAQAHIAGIIHRDMKPANMFLTKAADGTACIKVLDFGISKVVSAVDSLTRTQTTVGSPLYMSPEQMRSAKTVDARSDIWALGVTLYELLIGELPFVADSMPQLCALVLEANAPPIREADPNLPEELEQIVHKCLQRLPEDRYQNVGELAADLANILGSPEAVTSAQRTMRILSPNGEAPPIPVHRPTVTPGRSATMPGMARATQSSPTMSLGKTGLTEPAAAPASKRTGLFIVAGLAAAALIGGGVAVMARGAEDRKTANTAGEKAKDVKETKEAGDGAKGTPAVIPSTTVATTAVATATVEPKPSAAVTPSASASEVALKPKPLKPGPLPPLSTKPLKPATTVKDGDFGDRH